MRLWATVRLGEQRHEDGEIITITLSQSLFNDLCARSGRVEWRRLNDMDLEIEVFPEDVPRPLGRLVFKIGPDDRGPAELPDD